MLAAIERMEDEAAFEKIAAVVAQVLAPVVPHGQAGFMKGSVTCLAAPGFAAGPDFLDGR